MSEMMPQRYPARRRRRGRPRAAIVLPLCHVGTAYRPLPFRPPRGHRPPTALVATLTVAHPWCRPPARSRARPPLFFTSARQRAADSVAIAGKDRRQYGVHNANARAERRRLAARYVVTGKTKKRAAGSRQKRREVTPVWRPARRLVMRSPVPPVTPPSVSPMAPWRRAVARGICCGAFFLQRSAGKIRAHRRERRARVDVRHIQPLAREGGLPRRASPACYKEGRERRCFFSAAPRQVVPQQAIAPDALHGRGEGARRFPQ